MVKLEVITDLRKVCSLCCDFFFCTI